MNVDVGLMILVGIVVGGIAMLLTVKFMLSFFFKSGQMAAFAIGTRYRRNR